MHLYTLADLQRRLADVSRVDVYCPRLAGSVPLGALSAEQGLALARLAPAAGDSAADPAATVQFYAALIAACWLDPDGGRPLDTPEGRATLARLDLGSLTLLGQAAARLNGLGEPARNAEREALNESQPPPDADSASDAHRSAFSAPRSPPPDALGN